MTMYRAYGKMQFKAAQENGDNRTIIGVATTINPDRADDIVVPEGAEFNLPIPFLWQHRSSQPIGNVTKAKIFKDRIEVEIQIAKAGVLQFIDDAWALIKEGLVRGLSIGFRGIEVAEIQGSWGLKFLKWEWLELSAVTVPANADSSMTSIKSIDRAIRAAAGIKDDDKRGEQRPGASGTKKVSITSKKGAADMKLSEQIKKYLESLQQKQAEQDEIMTKSADAGETLGAEDQEAFDNLQTEIEALEKHVARLQTMEKRAALTSTTVIPATPVPGEDNDGERKVYPQLKTQETLEKGIRFARFAKCLGLGKINSCSPVQVAMDRFAKDDATVRLVKAAVAAANTGNATWAGALVGEESRAFADFVEFLRPMTILGKFGNGGVPSLRRVPFRVALIGQTTGGQGYWVGEGKAKPLTKFDFTRTTLEPLKVANIAVATMEVLRDSSPSADVIIRDQLAAALQERLDLDFINPAKAASAGVSPASITNGVTPVPSSGNTEDDIRADVKALMAKFIAANNAPTSGVWIMSSLTALSLSLMVNPLGQPVFTGIGINGGTFFGMPVITSEYIPSNTAGSLVILANASDIYEADDGGVSVDMSTEASLEMADNPTNASDTPTPATMVSLWQTNSVGFRAERTVNWAKRRASAVAVLSGVQWGA